MPILRISPHRSRRIYLLTLLFTLFSAPAWATFNTALTATHVQSVLQMHFPLREYTMEARITLHDPQVLLVKGASSMSLMIPVEINVPGQAQRDGHITVSVGLNYRPETGEVFLNFPQLQQFEMSDVTEDQKRELANMVRIVTAKSLPLVRIFKVKEHDLNHSLEKSTLKTFSIENNQLQLEFGFE